MKNVLVCGAGGFIGHHLVNFLKAKKYWVRAVDLKYPRFAQSKADDFVIGDLRNQIVCKSITEDVHFDEIYQLAADMGGAGFVFTGENDADIMHNSATINVNMIEQAKRTRIGKVFYSSSACIYPEYNQQAPNNPGLPESSAYPAQPDSDYGWEKLFSEHLYLAYKRNYNLDVHIARFHNITGSLGSYNDGREKAPAALCRKIAIAKLTNQESIIVWGDGKQTRSFLHIDDCLRGVWTLMQSNVSEPINIGSEEMISINDLAKLIMKIAGVNLEIKHDLTKPQGVRGRNSDNTLCKQKLNWEPVISLKEGLISTYKWIEEQVEIDLKYRNYKNRTLANAYVRDQLGL